MMFDVNIPSSLFDSFRMKFHSNPTLKYLYPPPSNSILTNITHALIAVPKFYVQVSKHCFSCFLLSFIQHLDMQMSRGSLPASVCFQPCVLFILFYFLGSGGICLKNVTITWNLFFRFLSTIQALKDQTANICLLYPN